MYNDRERVLSKQCFNNCQTLNPEDVNQLRQSAQKTSRELGSLIKTFSTTTERQLFIKENQHSGTQPMGKYTCQSWKINSYSMYLFKMVIIKCLKIIETNIILNSKQFILTCLIFLFWVSFEYFQSFGFPTVSALRWDGPLKSWICPNAYRKQVFWYTYFVSSHPKYTEIDITQSCALYIAK